ncbi:MAG TPA: LPS export ABC transporter permease LptG [Burkholderiales bacterium]|nr:LPS export ABC transporter permease LptG [Burkholderiales bacterium]
MRIINRFLRQHIFGSTLLVFAALLGLFALLDLIHELGDLGQANYRLQHILLYVLLSVPGHIYELFPIAALIGTLLALAQLVIHSEYTVIRVSGVSARDMVLSLMQTGLVFVVLTFVTGEFIAPVTERAAQQLRLRALKTVVAQEFRSGLWVKDERSFINVAQILPDTTLLGVRIFEFDPERHLRAISYAQKGDYVKDNQWRLHNVVQTRFDDKRATVNSIAEANWFSVLNPNILNVLLVVPEQMSAWNLYVYTQHLRENNQKTQRHDLALWTKITYPLAALVMMVLALPFAQYQRRTGGISARIFAGIMLGLGFHFLNKLFAHLGLLNDWPPFVSAMAPTLLFLAGGMAMLWWVERR